ncbi:MAG TPA: glycosyltransferase family 2 protein [bacterium]|nr:glycosyltransferase family 2 protein [bacterium]
MEISVVLPALNESENLAAVVEGLAAALAGAAARYEIIIVDDGSRDGTAAVADGLAKSDGRVRVVHHEKRRGYGAALTSGFAAAKYDWIFFTDADGQFDPAELSRLAAEAPGHRFITGLRARRADPWRRRAYGFIFSAAVRALFKVKATDVNCAFKLFRKDLISGHEFLSRGALINAEILAVAAKQGVDPVEIAVTHKPRLKGFNTGGSARVMARAGKEIVALYLDSRKKKKA